MHRPILSLLLCAGVLASLPAGAQTRAYKLNNLGNRNFDRALEGDSTAVATASGFYTEAMKSAANPARLSFNQGDTYLLAGNMEKAVKGFSDAAAGEPSATVRGMANHNLGVVSQSREDYAQAIEFYKEALRNNPNDEAARYNLALCQKLLKDNPPQDQEDNQDNEGEGQNDQQEQQQQDDQSQQDQQQEQEQKNQEQEAQQQPAEEEEAEQEEGLSEQSIEQLLNLARQREQQVRDKLQQAQPKQRQNQKNW